MGRMRSARLCLTFALLACSASARAGAWTADSGSIYAKLTYLSSSANNQFGFDGGTKPIVEGVNDYPYAERSLYLYAEYGLRNGLTIVAAVPFKRVFVHDKVLKYTTCGLGEVSLGARCRVLDSNGWVASVEPELGMPTGFKRTTRPPLGPGQVNLSMALNGGRSFYPAPAYASATAGFRYRSRLFLSGADPSQADQKPDYSHEVFYGLEAGWAPARPLMLHALLLGLRSLRSSGSGFSLTSLPTTQRYLKAGGGAGVKLMNRLELSTDVLGTVSGVNTSRSLDILLGMAAKW